RAACARRLDRPAPRLADPVVPLRHLARTRAELPASADLLGVRARRPGGARTAARHLAQHPPRRPVPPLGQLRLRPGARNRSGLGPIQGYGAHASSAHRREIGAVMPEQRNLILAIVLSVTIIIAFQYFYELPRIQEAQRQQQRTEQVTERAPDQAKPEALAPAPPGTPAAPEAARAEALATTERVAIENARVEGSLALTGGRIDNLVLLDYRETTAPDSENVRLLNPPGAPDTYFAEFGWVAGDEGTAVPGRDAVWQASADEVRPDQPVTLTWDNGENLRFTRTIAIDDNFMFTITQRVENTGDEPVTLYPYGLISRWGTPDTL